MAAEHEDHQEEQQEQRQQQKKDRGAMSMRLPILVILGATGSGKSRLGIELARKFGGEIISADSMQVYKSLDIITAKVTPEEQAMAPHHMLDVMDPLNEFTVVDFRNRALPIMNDLVKSDKIPIIVGGTNYYIESLIWKILIDGPGEQQQQQPPTIESDDAAPCLKVRRIEGISSEELHEKLALVDPEMASRLHPNNRRKIIRSLEIFDQHGVTHTELLRQQREAGGTGLGGPLRHENTLILWLTCNTVVLDERLNSRVDSMLKAGLVQELLDFHERYNKDRIKKNEDADYTRGIFQSIGFKEFHNYLILPKEKRESKWGEKLLKESIANLKLATRRYARKQQKWVRNRLIRRSDRQVPLVYTLDCTNVGLWESEVYGKAVDIVEATLRGETPSQRAINERIDNAKLTDSSNESSNFCEDCQRVFIGELQWNAHLEGAKHKKMLAKKKRLREEEEAAEKSTKKNAESVEGIEKPIKQAEVENSKEEEPTVAEGAK